MKLLMGFYVDSVPFTRAVIDGTASLGGAESACLGLARALVTRGHEVHIIATQLDEDCFGPDAWGVVWHPADAFGALNQYIEWDVFTVLRMYPFLSQQPIRARLRLLWNQDLLTQPRVVMSAIWAADAMVYVSEYQRRQYEDRIADLAGIPAYVTKNGYDPARVPTNVTKDPHRIIHVSRPERGLRPLLQMWPEIRKADPRAELRICRYNSMYDAQGWGKICASYDQGVAEVHEQVGGIVQLGELGKARLYQEIAEAAVMWYPGVHDFAETSCIAAIESQACGTPFVGSWKGALPETVPSGVLVKGDADTKVYQQEAIANVLDLLKGCADRTFAYRQRQKLGLEHVKGYTYTAIAGEWETWLDETFERRYQTHTIGILRQFLHDDDHVAAKLVAADILDREFANERAKEADEARAYCDKVIAGKDQVADDYAAHALDTLEEVRIQQQIHGRLDQMARHFEGCQHVLDVACGNGSFALMLAQRCPDIKVTGIDYAIGNVESARRAAETLGLSDRVTFVCAPFWDFDTQTPAGDPLAVQLLLESSFDGAFIGEFIEHVAACEALVDYVESFLAPGAQVVYTCPHGPFTDMLPRNAPVHRGHVHQFCHDDLMALFGQKHDVGLEYVSIGVSRRGADLGHWIITYKTGGGTARPRPLENRIKTCRPLQRLSVGLIVGPHEPDLRRCLESVWAIADEIVIGDCDTGDTERAVAAEYGARLIDIGKVEDLPAGFSGARNAVLEACTGDVFLWIDADERLLGPVGLRKYFESGPFIGWALHQNHLLIDGANHYDTPVRIFRKRPDIQFYGCVHEQPQQTDCNTEIMPALELSDVAIAHTGYLIEPTRRGKMLQRNLPLLKRDQVMFPERRLGRLLWLRDFTNIADYEREQAGGQITPKVKALYAQTIGLFEKEFADPTDKYYGLARPWYEKALQALELGYEIEFSLAGRRGGLRNTHAKPHRFWIRQHADLARVVEHELADIRKGFTPEPLKTDPFPPIASAAVDTSIDAAVAPV